MLIFGHPGTHKKQENSELAQCGFNIPYFGIYKVVCWVFGFLKNCRVIKKISVDGKIQNFFAKAFTRIQKKHLSAKRQVKTRFFKLLNVHWILSTMHPKWAEAHN